MKEGISRDRCFLYASYFSCFRSTSLRRKSKDGKKLAQAELKLEQQNALIREQFIAVLGHDLRNPLSAL
ncbi:hypothetical protein OKW96_21010 [Sphingobacterium sp. KU25419]|nr:hypothetical protein OKW96_21010 [Sphingobacterium sp. KU25419]